MLSGSSEILQELSLPKNIKVAILGDEKSGKTALVQQLTGGKFSAEYRKTSAISLSKKRVMKKDHHDILLEISDFGGDKKYEASMPSYLYEANTVVIVWDITNQTSFNRANDYFKLAKASVPKHCKFIFVANKNDLKATRVVDAQAGKDFASDNSADFFETSALDGENVAELFAATYASSSAVKKSGKRLYLNRVAPKKKYQDLVTEALTAYHNQIILDYKTKLTKLPDLSKAEPKPEPKVELKAEPKPDPKAEPKIEPKADPKPAPVSITDLIEESALALYREAQRANFDKLITAENATAFCQFLKQAGTFYLPMLISSKC